MELTAVVEINSIVGRLSYNCDLLFRVIEITEMNGKKVATLIGEDFRLIADAPLDDLVLISPSEHLQRSSAVRSMEEQSFQLFKQDLELLQQKQEYTVTNGYQRDISYFQIPGRILHLDGDRSYLEKCLQLYEEFGVSVYGVHCDEKEMHLQVESLLEKYRPDILVITGHDSYSKSKGKKTDLNAYRHSKYFVETVKAARRKYPNLDQLIIFAGACQSHFESLIQAGANFASSPLRVNIHALDPVYIVSKICYIPFVETINVWDVLRNTLTGEKGIGGIESRGVLRMGMPFEPILDEE